ncbi:cold-inducible protein YdjO-related protein [Paenibacillus flagellatus]|uniref:Cold-shock protein n=1 Tax=Paenibacillus flagellatus TaxID=2211139 RepID=A0A2V5K6L8_9BACL|nr:cold-inducible protein YdjO-related protein [Paenibacillus flagellatus]PYI54462.1 hypothetical protein DLM86_13420 [Paenibacillus flagellatus]
MNKRRRFTEELPLEETEIWSCTNDGCNGWMRDDFAFDHTPTCRLCLSPMTRTMKMVPAIAGPSGGAKPLKSGTDV